MKDVNKKHTLTLESLNILFMKCRKYGQVPRLELMSGANLSVQVSRTHYCKPRNDQGPWVSAEIGFPSIEFIEWVERKGIESEMGKHEIYPYTDLSLIVEFINEHGGIRFTNNWREHLEELGLLPENLLTS